MSDALSFTEFDGQQVELLAPRTVLSMISGGGMDGSANNGTEGSGLINNVTAILHGNGVGVPGSAANGESS